MSSFYQLNDLLFTTERLGMHVKLANGSSAVDLKLAAGLGVLSLSPEQAASCVVRRSGNAGRSWVRMTFDVDVEIEGDEEHVRQHILVALAKALIAARAKK